MGPPDGATANRGLRPASGVELHLLKEEGILFDRPGQTLYLLNGTAACVWCHLERQADVTTVTAATAQCLGTGYDSALRYVRDITNQWRDLGLLAGSRRGGRPRRPRMERRKADDGPTEPAQAGCRRYRILDSVVSIAFPDRALESLVCPILRHLEIGSATRADIALAVTGAAGRWEVRRGRRVLATGELPEALAPVVEGLLIQLAVGRCRYFMALHAAAAASPEGCLLLPGPSGCGKTTLVGALADAGWRYMSDDLVLLEEQDLRARAVPESLCIKEDAWSLLSRRWPDLAELAPHLRHDGKQARYLTPPLPSGGHDGAGGRVRWIVFPRYHPAADTELRALTPGEGLQRVMSLCSGLRAPLDSAKVRRLVRWASGIDFFELQLSDLDRAISRLATLTAGEAGQHNAPPSQSPASRRARSARPTGRS